MISQSMGDWTSNLFYTLLSVLSYSLVLLLYIYQLSLTLNVLKRKRALYFKPCYLNTGQTELTDGRGFHGGSAHHTHKRIAGHRPSRDRLNHRRRARGDEHGRSRSHPTQSGGVRDHPEPRRSFGAHVPQLRLSFNALDRDHSCCILYSSKTDGWIPRKLSVQWHWRKKTDR